jgi:hypothetical protein
MISAEFYDQPDARVLIEGIEQSGMVVDIEPLVDMRSERFVSFMALVLPKFEFSQQLRTVDPEQHRQWKRRPEELPLGSQALPLPLDHHSVLLWDHLIMDSRTAGGETLFLAVDSALHAALRHSSPHRQRPARRRR